mgnify:FL=1
MDNLNVQPVFIRKVKKVIHYAYKDDIDLKSVYIDAEIVLDAKYADKGDWVSSHNGVLSQVIQKGTVGKTPYIRTIYGMFNTNATTTLPNEPHKNIYGFTKTYVWSDSNKIKTTAAEEAFARLIAQAVPKDIAFLQSFGERDIQYVKRKSTYLLRQKRIKKIVNKELKKTMDSVGLDEEFLMTNLFDIIMNADRYGDKKAAIEMACKLRGMFPKEKQTGALSIMQEVRGFTRQEIEQFQKPSLEIPNPEKSKDDN